MSIGVTSVSGCMPTSMSSVSFMLHCDITA